MIGQELLFAHDIALKESVGLWKNVGPGVSPSSAAGIYMDIHCLLEKVQ